MEYKNLMIEAKLESEQCNNDITEQIAFENKIKILTEKSEQVEKQLSEVKYYLSIFDDYSAKIKAKYLEEVVKELENTFS